MARPSTEERLAKVHAEARAMCKLSFVTVRKGAHNPWMRRVIFPAAKGRRWPVSITRGRKTGDAWTPWKTRHIWLHVFTKSFGIKFVSAD